MIGRWAQERGQSFAWGFILALLFTPFVASFFVATLRPTGAKSAAGGGRGRGGPTPTRTSNPLWQRNRRPSRPARGGRGR